MKNIIIFEDNKYNALYIEYVLKKLGYNTKTFILAKEGLEYINNNYDNISLIFMDINLPDMNGIDALKIIKNEHPNLPVIILTAQAYDNDMSLSYDAGCEYFMIKPISHNLLKNKIKEYILK